MSFGRPYLVNIDGCVHDGWLILTNYESKYNDLFLYYLLRSDNVQCQFNGSASGAVVKNLNSDIVRKVKIIQPPIELQNKFAEFVQLIDKSKLNYIKK